MKTAIICQGDTKFIRIAIFPLNLKRLSKPNLFAIFLLPEGMLIAMDGATLHLNRSQFSFNLIHIIYQLKNISNGFETKSKTKQEHVELCEILQRMNKKLKQSVVFCVSVSNSKPVVVSHSIAFCFV